jgi:hypothetical protein
MPPLCVRTQARSFPAARALCCAACAVLLASGCGSNRVTGQVTLNGEPVTDGVVVFIDAANQRKAAPIHADGRYLLDDPPAGNCRVAVKNLGTLRGESVRPPLPQEVLDKLPPQPAPSPAVPARYGQPGNGLEFEVAGGRQVFDIELTSNGPADEPSGPWPPIPGGGQAGRAFGGRLPPAFAAHGFPSPQPPWMGRQR